jgi:hypothetical protein
LGIAGTFIIIFLVLEQLMDHRLRRITVPA